MFHFFNKKEEIIYKIDHYYNYNHNESCLMIRCDIDTMKLVKILAAIQFKFEELIDKQITVNEKHILEILETYYGVENVKDKFRSYHKKNNDNCLKYKEYLPYMQIKDNEWRLVNVFKFKKARLQIIQIDMYESREAFCTNHNEIMNEVLPNGKELENMINTKMSFYI